MSEYLGILCIGDPHLCTWAPGYRKDDYSKVVLAKLCWALDYARANNLLPVLLGDLFHVPRDNANWLIAELMNVLNGEILTLVGNHDRSEDLLCEHDSLAVLLAAGRLRCLDENPWIGQMNGVPVAIGGTNNGHFVPRFINRDSFGQPRWVFWMTHHDFNLTGDIAEGQIDCHEITGVDLVVNGHIHRTQPDALRNATLWCNPGNITRVGRSDYTRLHIPGVLKISPTADAFTTARIAVPYQPFDESFYPAATVETGPEVESSFITGLQSMQKFKTADGEGLRRLIESNLSSFGNDRVKEEILNLLNEVLPHGGIQKSDGDNRTIAQTV